MVSHAYAVWKIILFNSPITWAYGAVVNSFVALADLVPISTSDHSEKACSFLVVDKLQLLFPEMLCMCDNKVDAHPLTILPV